MTEDRRVARRLVLASGPLPVSPAGPRLVDLTLLQLEYLVRRAYGQGNDEIARARDRSIGSIRNASGEAYRKLGVNGSEAVISAFRVLGWLTVPPDVLELVGVDTRLELEATHG